MLKFISLTFYVGLLLLITSSCIEKKTESIHYKGTLTYRINYLQTNINSSISKKLLPQRMILEFDENYSLITIEGFLGFFKLVNIINFNTKRCTTVLEILNSKYVSFGGRGSKICCFEPMKKMKIIETGIKKNLQGLNAYKIQIQLPEEKFDIYYTKDIALPYPNFNNDYKEVNGVLLDFRLKMAGTYMQFILEKFEINNSEDKIKIELPNKYRIVTREQMNELIKKLLS